MPKGLFTASVCVLFEGLPALAAVEERLEAAGAVVRGRKEAAGKNPWLGGPSIVAEMRPEVNGLVTVDLADMPWPDTMGDPQDRTELFAAWSFGAFGPFVFPGNLERAAQHAIRWPEAGRTIGAHTGFVRLRSSYVLGQPADTPVLPEGYDPLFELRFLTDLASALLALPASIAFFCPSGEVLSDADQLEGALRERDQDGMPPLDVFSNVRFFRIGDAKGWALMDTVGMEQLGVTDTEAAFPLDTIEPDAVAGFLRDLSLFQLNESPTFESGDTIEGPGGIWRASLHETSLVPAPRPTIRWRPAFGQAPPDDLAS
ncbi:MAG: DUF4261 domain-containing protein [Sandaracinaceae bacterium]